MPVQQVAGFVRRLVTRILEDEVPDLAAGLAYRFLFALFPFAIFLAALAAFVAPALGLGDPTAAIVAGLSGNLPPAVTQQLGPQLETVLGTTRPGLLSIGALAALWAAASGIGSVMGAMNRAYEVEETRGFVHRTGLAIVLTVMGGIGIVIALVAIIGGSVITQGMVERLGLGAATWDAIVLLRLPLFLLLVSLAVGVLFKLGPNVSVSFRWAAAGGAVFAVGWLVGTLLFGLYVANLGSYANTYGALGGVVILMLWFYLTGFLLLAAAEVTSQLASEREPHVVRARRRELQAQARPSRARDAQAAPADLGRHATRQESR